MKAPTSDWLRGPAFDLALIVGVFVLALGLGGAAAIGPELFTTIILLDIWLLAYPHVASTYTRIAFDRASARRHWFLLAGLPPLVLAGTAGVVWFGGVVALNSLYFYWQSWHYTRQSYGIARAYQRGGASGPAPRDRLTDLLIFAFPLWGLLHRAHQRPPIFYADPLWSPPVPRAAVLAAGALALAALFAWLLRLVRDARASAPRGRGHALFVLSHLAITALSYLLIEDITAGWLFINIWHNAQYLLFVWAANARRFRGGVEPGRPFLSRLCQPEHALRYGLVCLGLGAGFYFVLGRVSVELTTAALPMVLILHQTVNFHHYLVDAVIWRSDRAPA